MEEHAINEGKATFKWAFFLDTTEEE